MELDARTLLRNAARTELEVCGLELDSSTFKLESCGAEPQPVHFSRSLMGAIETMKTLGKAGFWLDGLDLYRANLEQLEDPHAQMRSINLANTVLTRADLRYANLKQINFTNVDLSRANLTGADLTDANLTGTQLDTAISSRVIELILLTG